MKIKHMTRSAAIAALYVILTYVSNSVGLSNGAIQVRLSEALTILPYYTFDACMGLFLGCIIANTLTGCVLIDIIFGSIATLIGAIGTYLISKRHKKTKWIASLPPILSNSLIIPFIIRYAYVGASGSLPVLILSVAIGEIISSGILGTLLLKALTGYKHILFED